MDVSRETPDVTTKPKCYDLTNILVCTGLLRLSQVKGVPKKGVPAIAAIDQQFSNSNGYCESCRASLSTNSGLR